MDSGGKGRYLQYIRRLGRGADDRHEVTGHSGGLFKRMGYKYFPQLFTSGKGLRVTGMEIYRE